MCGHAVEKSVRSAVNKHHRRRRLCVVAESHAPGVRKRVLNDENDPLTAQFGQVVARTGDPRTRRRLRRGPETLERYPWADGNSGFRG